jgi:hypothetical protein
MFCIVLAAMYLWLNMLQNNRGLLKGVFPHEWFDDVPDWLPDDFRETFQELLFVRGQHQFRSVVAIAGLLLEAHVNEQIPTLGDKKKSLFERLQYLKVQGKIDQDQFSDATIARITRNGVLHPTDILEQVNEKDADEVMGSVIAYLERAYKYRSSRALPPASPEIDLETVA